ncbi:MAG: DUF1553 domain-containing protein [Planctomycetes bacterium]|nr:DUF1553 domain-containing protein [Planctomycetota bacterium]
MSHLAAPRHLFVLALLTGSVAASVAADQVPDFATQVRPILSKHCFSCHGPDDKGRKGKLRLDLRESAIGKGKSGEIAIVPGKPAASEVVKRIFTSDEDDLMPPPEAKKPLSEVDKDILKRWIAGGADYQPHWAFQPPVQAPLPAVKNAAWSANAIDRFVLAKLEAEKLAPSPEADRTTLIRRVSLDLIGLPPTPADVDVFLADQSPDAYAKLVDRLLASKHYGERWARKWLDLARYADTNGYEKDRPRSMWPWRDWVITALNDDLPFDQFTIKQLAGDLLPDATQQDRIATGFHRNTMINEEGGTDPLEFRYHAVNDRVATTGKTWLGLTTLCAQCHTHKFDPIPHTEYFGLYALMNNADEPVLMLKPEDFPAKQAEVEAKIAKLIDDLPAKYPVDTRVWAALSNASFTSESGETAEHQGDGSWRLSGDGQERDTLTITIDTDATEFSLLRLEALPDGDLRVGRSDSGNFVITDLAAKAGPIGGEMKPVTFKSISADHSQKDYDVKGAIDADHKTGWAVAGGDMKATRTATAITKEPVKADQPLRVVVTIAQQYGSKHTLRRFRLSFGRDEPARATVEARRTAADAAFSRWSDEATANTVAWRAVKPAKVSSAVPILTVLDDNSVLSSGDITKSDVYDVTLNGDFTGVTALRLEALPDERLPGGGPGRVHYEGQPGDFILTELTAQVDGQPAIFARAAHSYANGGNHAAKAVDGKTDTGWTINGQPGKAHAALFVFDKPLGKAAEVKLAMLFERYYASALGRFRWSVTTAAAPNTIAALPPEIETLLLIPVAQRSPEQLATLRRHWLATASELADARKDIEHLRGSLRSYPTTLVFKERAAEHTRATFLHHRGEYLQPGEQVEPAIISVLNPFPAGAPKNRLGLAQWLVARENPLTARVTVNRQWAAFFGRGIVRTVDDFGYQGEYPSHRALLDWLAVEFMQRGWSMKTLHKTIVTSATYRQSSRVSDAAYARDPQNVLLARGPRFRVDAEVIRDSLLTVSGLLSHKVGGPSVFPPQPASVTNEGAYGRLDWKISDGEDRYRRGLYTFMKRTAPYAMSAAFDAPSGEACVALREVSNSPLQALMMLNDTVVLECAQALGKQIATLPGDDAVRIAASVRSCLARIPGESELKRLTTFVVKQRARFTAKDLDPAPLAGAGDGDVIERAVWTALARALMNTDEFVSKE